MGAARWSRTRWLGNEPIRVPAAALAVLVLIAGITGHFALKRYESELIAERHTHLLSVARLESTRLAQWLKERTGDAETLRNDTGFGEGVQEWLREPRRQARAAERIRSRLTAIQRSYRYAAVTLVDADGRVALSSDQNPMQLEPEDAVLVRAAVAASEVKTSDLHHGTRSPDNIDLAAPLMTADGKATGAAVLLTISATELTESRPRRSLNEAGSERTLLVTRQGKEAVYVAQLGFAARPFLGMRVPVDEGDAIASQAARGARGIVYGIDYRNVRVAAAIVDVPGTPWQLIAQVDNDEIEAPLRQRALLITLVGLGFVVLAGVLVFQWIRQRETRYRLQHAQAEVEHHALTEHYEYLTKHAGDAIFLFDEWMHILDANQKAVELYGYSLEQLIGADARMLRAQHAAGSFDQVWEDLRNTSAKRYETQHRRKDGALIDVEVSSRRLQIGEKVFVQAIVRDISTRVRAEQAQKRHYALVKLLGDLAACANEARTPDEALRTSVRLICEHGAWSAGHAVTFTPDATYSTAVTSVWYPEQDGGLAAFRQYCDERNCDHPAGCLLYATVVQKEPVWLTHIGEAAASQEVTLLRQANIESTLAFPVLLHERVVALLEFFSREARALDELFLDNIANITSRLSRPIERFHATAVNAALAAVVASSDDAIVSRDMERRIVSWNAGAERLFGYTAEEAIGKNISMLIPPDMEADAAASRERLKDGRTLKSHDVVRLAKGGRRIDVSLTQSPIRDESGQMVGVSLIFHDISERKQAMLEQERLAALVESSNDAIITRTLEGAITSWNAGAARMFGYTAEEALGRRLSFLLPPAGVAMLDRVNDRLLAGEPVEPFRSTRLTKDGRRIEALVSVSPVRGKSGAIEGASVIFQDVSRLKQAELALTESEERFRAAFDQAAVGMALHTVGDVAPRWVRVNRTLCEILGYTEQELLNSGPFDVTPDEDRAESRDYMRKLIAGDLPGYIRERRYRRKDGNIIWGKVSASLVRNAQGNVTHVMSVIEDVTPQKLAEQALEEAQQELELAVNSASIGIWDWNPVTDEMFFSREWKALLGYEDAEIPNEKSEWERLCHPDDLGRVYSVLDQCMRDPAAKYDVELRMRHKDGSYRWVLSRASIYRDADGRAVRVIGAHIDISERKKTEAQLARLTHFYAASSQTSEAIIRISDRQQLLQRVCEIAVENTGLLMAWIGFVDGDTGFIRPLAVAGEAADYVHGLEISIRQDLVSGQGPSGRAIREGMPHLTRDFDTSMSTTPWRLRAREFGIRSSAAFPLTEQGKACGSLCLYAAEADFFDPELTQLLQHIAEDISFALETMQREVARQRAEQELRLSAQAFECIADGVMITDQDSRIISVNKAFTTITGYSAEEAVGKTPALLKSDRQDRAFYETLWATLKRSGHWQGEVWNRRKNGEIYPELLSISAVTDTAGEVTHYVGVFNDISQFKAYEARLEYLAHHDALTDLPNRALLSDRVDVAIAAARRHGKRLALLFVDLDRFKLVNDSLGHAIGDALLQSVAERVKQSVRASDTVSRHGGDEFLVLLPEVDEVEDVARVAEKLMENLTAPHHIRGHELVTTVSIGIAVYPDNGQQMGDLLRNADAAMYAAKDLGRNRYQFYTDSMNVRAAERLTLEHDLRFALERNQLYLVYQPQIDLASGRVIGLEALTRWSHPQLGLVPPTRFIAVAEDSGLIVKIGEWVLRTACEQNKRWHDTGLLHVPVAVNVSAIQFRQATFGKVVTQVLEDTGLSPTYLELEVTESVVMEAPEAMLDKLRELDRRGLRLSIDDFGTGYSSLSYLRNLRIHQLKIDRSFVQDLPQNRDSAAITQAIVSMGRSLGLTVIAEGVERADQAAFLHEINCACAQGFLYCIPLPPHDLEQMLKKMPELRGVAAASGPH